MISFQHFLNELLINLLVRQKSFFLLHQLLQYHVISDSKPLACLLLSLENVYPASYQLALDMLARWVIFQIKFNPNGSSISNIMPFWAISGIILLLFDYSKPFQTEFLFWKRALLVSGLLRAQNYIC